MIISRDYFDNPIIPDYVLCKANKERIGILKCASKTLDIKFKAPNEITCTVYMKNDDHRNLYYESVDVMKYILLPNYGFFSISSCKMQSEGTDLELKEISAKSFECLLAQRYLEEFTINMGTTESIDSVSLYNFKDKNKSLLNLVLDEKASEWKIGYVDNELASKQRSFEIDKKDIYSFLIEDVAGAFECVVIFDSLNNTINIYKKGSYGKDTNIHVSYNNLLKKTNISCSISDIKTCIIPTGSEDISIREINMGSNRLIDLSYFHSTDYMSQSLYDSFAKWQKLISDNKENYNTYLKEYQNYYSKINHLTNKKMPDNPESTDWNLYGLIPLKEQLSVYEQKQSVMMKAGWGDISSTYYESSYIPTYNTIQEIKNQISVIEKELLYLKEEQNTLYNKMLDIMNLTAMENNFSESELAELNSFIREDELTSENYVVTESMNDEERFSMLNDLLEYAEKELKRVSMPQLSFDADLANIFEIKEFESLYGQFDIGNYIWISLRDDYHVKTRILEIHFDFFNTDNFKVKFGNLIQVNNIILNMMDRITNIENLTTSVAFNKSYWSQAGKDATNINQMLADGLLSQGNYITNNPDDSEFVIDKRGIFVNTITGDYAYKDSIYLGGGRILFTSDNWKTVCMAVGRADINGESRFGVFADFCIASYIAGSTMESSIIKTTKMEASEIYGTKITGGEIYSINYSSTSGTYLNLNDGTFSLAGGSLIYDGTALKFNSSDVDEYVTTITKNTVTTEYVNALEITAKSVSADWVYAGNIEAGQIKSGSLVSSDGISTVLNLNDGTLSMGKGSLVWDGTTLSVKGNVNAVSGIIGGCTISDGVLKIKNANIGEKITADSIDAENLKVNAVNVMGILTANQIDATDLKVSAANVTGQLTASQINTTGLIAENISATDIVGKNISGGSINIGDGVFYVDQNGAVTCTDATVTGVLNASSNSSLGGFKTDSNSLYNGTWGTTAPAVFMCTGSSGTYTIGGKTTSGWVFGAGTTFGVTKSGGLYCSGGQLGGFAIKGSSFASSDFGVRESDSRSIGLSLSLNGNMFEAMKGSNGLSVNANGVIYVNDTYTLAKYIENIAYQLLKTEGLVN